MASIECSSLTSEDEEVSFGTRRKYILDQTGEEFYSVTTVLAATADDTALKKWRKSIGEDAAERIVNAAKKRGDILHKYCERYLLNEQILDYSLLDKNFQIFEKVKKIIDERIDNIFLVEKPLYSRELHVAGKPDAIAEYLGKPTVIDFKSIKSLDKIGVIDRLLKYILQITAYAIMYEELTEVKITQGLILFGPERKRDAAKPFLFQIDENHHKAFKKKLQMFNEINP